MLLKPVSLTHALQVVGIDQGAALGRAKSVPSYFQLVTPVASCDGDIDTSKFYRSIREHVDDVSKKSNFAILLNALSRSSVQENYQEVLKGTNVIVKIAHEFTHANKKHKVWEVKQGKKDRLYFFTTKAKTGLIELPVIVLLLAYHKKDQTTPTEVSRYAESTMKDCLPPKDKASICKEKS